MQVFTRLAPLLILAALVASCSAGSSESAVSTSTVAPISGIRSTTVLPSTTTSTTTTTTTPPIFVSAAVNGLDADADAISRRAVVIKIDNHQKARPQTGLMNADLMYEMLVEGGITRFAAVFHQTDLDWVGPVRSGRPTDVGVVKALDAPFQISGAQGWVLDIFRSHDLPMVYDNGVTTWREPHRKAPHNLYSSSTLIREYADDRGWGDESPGNVFTFGEPTESSTEATEIHFGWSSSFDIVWSWDGEKYLRHTGEAPHLWVTRDGVEDVVSTPMIVAIVGERTTYHNPAGGGTSLPTTLTEGSGDAYVFRNGIVVEGMWQRDSMADMFTLTTPDGDPLIVPPSKMWIAVFPDDRTISWN